jgi:hypothetical protein
MGAGLYAIVVQKKNMMDENYATNEVPHVCSGFLQNLQLTNAMHNVGSSYQGESPVLA